MADMNVDDLKGRPVIDNRGATLGEVADFSIDPQQWRVTGVVVSLRKEVADDLNVQRPLMGGAKLQLGAERIQTLGENVILNLDTDSIAGAIRRSG